MSSPELNVIAGKLPEETAKYIAWAISGLQYGTVEIVVHDSKIVQIDRNERIRMPAPAKRPIPQASTH